MLAGIPFFSIAYGIQWGRFNFSVRNLKLTYPNLPTAFDGLRVVQISDFHIGSFLNSVDKVQEAVELINKQDADLLLFTGDMVNHVATEIDGFINVMQKMKANIGKYSILGNHDYGDYVRWNSKAEKQGNLDKLLSRQREIGLNLLLNDSKKIKMGNEQIELIGVENWGLPPFPQYGDLDKALTTTEIDSFKILMSHDPSHWDEEVVNKTSIDLTLSGHTHGAQFGIEIPGWRWSPVNMRYKRWGGLYSEGKQKLYVNTGIGFIGFPGRVGMPPEITVIELKNG
jgi:predicted MPP superfamily phosphohydrolase